MPSNQIAYQEAPVAVIDAQPRDAADRFTVGLRPLFRGR
jgi:hypothetical protein